jgi:hypothetical protein
MICAFGSLEAALFLVDGNGRILSLSMRNSILLAATLFVICFVSAILVIMYDRPKRVAAIVVLLLLLISLLLALPAL